MEGGQAIRGGIENYHEHQFAATIKSSDLFWGMLYDFDKTVKICTKDVLWLTLMCYPVIKAIAIKTVFTFFPGIKRAGA